MAFLGKFVTFGGLDGSGKTLQSELLHKALLKQGEKKIIRTSEPTQEKYGSIIRQKLVDADLSSNFFDWEMSLLFALDRKDHLYGDPWWGVVNCLEEGYTVICDRYTFCSFAYNGQGEMASLVAFLNKDFPVPDLTIYIDIDVNVALQRIAQRGLPADAYEKRLHHYKAGYEAAMQQSQHGCLGNIVTVDGDRSVEEVHQEILSIVNNLEK